jgi:GTP-binding protein
MLCNRKDLAMTSSKPGKTLLINHFLINNSWHLVDLPGYGYATAGKKMREQLKNIIESYILYREQLTCVFLLIDSRHEPQKIDLDFMEWMGENGVPFSIVFTKLDKMSAVRSRENLKLYQEKLHETWEELPPIFATSSEKRTGRDEVLGYIADINMTLKK